MKALVTGSAGFLGRHFRTALATEGYEVTGLDSLDAPSRDVRRFLPEHRADYDLVVHAAGYVGGRETIDGAPVLVGTENLSIDAAVFEWCALNRPGRLLYISSSAAYPVRLQTEELHGVLTEQLQPTSLDGLPHVYSEPDATYGWAKLTGERMCRELRKLMPVTVVRPFSGYGADQALAYPFPRFVQRARERMDPFPVWGSADQVRDWIHVDDVVGGALALCAADVDGPVNLCSGEPTSMRKLATLICDEVGYHPSLVELAGAPMGVFHRVGDPARMLEHYKLTVPLREGIRRAVSGE